MVTDSYDRAYALLDLLELPESIPGGLLAVIDQGWFLDMAKSIFDRTLVKNR